MYQINKIELSKWCIGLNRPKLTRFHHLWKILQNDVKLAVNIVSMATVNWNKSKINWYTSKN
jgi:hypothetical protein